MAIDVLVVGAGPAGASAAYFLKHYDKDDLINVDLVDRLDSKRYSEYHDMCGEAVTQYLFEELLPLKPEGIVEKIKLIKEYWPGDIEIDTPVEGYIIDRTKFLESITDEFRKKGGNFENKSVKVVSQKGDVVGVGIGNESKEYDYVIAADGANSMIRKSLGIHGRTRNFIQYIIDKEPEQGALIFYNDEKYEGDYLWEFPHEGKTKVGYPLLPELSKPKGKIIKKQSRAIGYGGVDKYVDGKILLVGDAACQDNIITKGGIRPGMVAGRMAAEAVVKGNPENYQKEWLKTDFASTIFLEAFEKLSRMDNKELEYHIKPFKGVDFQNIFQSNILYFKLLLFYRKYLKLYKAYDLSEKVGW